MQRTRYLVFTALLAALTAAGAYLQIPLPPSAFTAQSFCTAMAGILLGPRYGALSQGLYVALGLLGLPIFAGGSGGFSTVLQPTFGFLLGFVVMAAVTGYLTRRLGTTFWRLCLAAAAGMAALYAVGLPYMHFILNVVLDTPMTFGQTAFSGMVLFLPWDAVKVAGSALLGRRLLPVLQPSTATSAAAATSAANSPRKTNTIR